LPPRILRPRIIETLEQEEEIISIFHFLCEVGYFNYFRGLMTFRKLHDEGLITMTKTNGRGSPWRVTRSEQWKTLVSGSVDCSVASRH
jgi:hypothetical protein